MTRPLRAKITPTEGGVGQVKPSGSSIRHFVYIVFDGESPFHNWVPQAA